jgi:hypothetical protein
MHDAKTLQVVKLGWASIRHKALSVMRNTALSTEEWKRLWLLCDGFGMQDEAFANQVEWDWSHVRDSSYPALLTVLQAHLSLHSRLPVVIQPTDACPVDELAVQGIERKPVLIRLEDLLPIGKENN